MTTTDIHIISEVFYVALTGLIACTSSLSVYSLVVKLSVKAMNSTRRPHSQSKKVRVVGYIPFIDEGLYSSIYTQGGAFKRVRDYLGVS